MTRNRDEIRAQIIREAPQPDRAVLPENENDKLTRTGEPVFPLQKERKEDILIPQWCGVIRCVGGLSPAQVPRSWRSWELPLYFIFYG